ncbi:DNA-directed DNA polymerase [Lapidilactobacillus dextrinicus DSM 20335]|uniref:DNA-directed DNA polymerase n=1 Tax=Lapidilactobacillus dextrinicus DSM 20335 TaxID=1423738 RepID=A0A0R2BS29_9LACO|nr:DNA polymerase III subunit gamma/tau [Lapidilactobacillus dextrinicus]KRM79129.1 DNA-directed DNA polymerase [Lapidilactobacillus dextrinicus DSM 20335]QFG47024.1 DNA polymerase III subunit gamma/tau [Lapidilactobacillus dextrinicus]
MAYQALYRVWRPQNFQQVVGQKIVTQTLKNSITTDQISHAYLFAGPRGTGKTSCAKIFAKAINCLDSQDGEPCNHCENCVAINENRLTDIIEIDAASNNGVDEIRDIRDKVKYPPTQAKYKVYIIDEVHMLSTGAFNALLKTLEEPPAHVVFILATTEIQKVPATIISRTQRFNFRRISADDIAEQLIHILTEKNISYDDQAIAVISRAADGGMRDALSILDQVLSFGNDHVSLENALEVTGDADDQSLAHYLSAIFNQNVTEALQTINTLFADGCSANRLIEGIIELLRDLLLQKNDAQLLTQMSYRQLDADLITAAAQIQSAQLYQMIDLTNEIQLQLKNSAHSELFLEVMTVKLANVAKTAAPVSEGAAANQAEVEKLQTQVAELKQQLSKLENHGVAVSPRTTMPKASTPVHKTDVKINRQQVYHVLENATKESLTAVRDVWPDLLSKLTPAKRAMMKVSQPVAASADAIVVAFTYEFTLRTATTDQDLQDALKQELNALMQNEADIILVQKDQWPKIRKEYIATLRQGKTEKPTTQATPPAELAQPTIVAEATKLFGDKIVKVEAN